MNNRRRFGKLIKLITSLVVHSLKITTTFGFYLLGKIFKGIGKRLKFSITFKTATIYTLIFSTVLFVFSLILVSAFTGFLFHESKSSLDKSARFTEASINDNLDIPEVQIKRYADVEGVSITIFNSQRDVIYTTEQDPDNVTFNEARDLSGITVNFDQISLNKEVKIGGNPYFLQVSRSIAREVFYVTILLACILASFMLAILFTVTVGSKTLRRMLRPIDNMINTARSISAQDLDTRLNVVNSHDELKELAETFNEMLDRIQASYEQQNRFVSDASHELRTPISVIQGYANLLNRWGKDDKAVLEESISAIKNEADNMKDLVEKLLFLARADKNTQNVVKTSFFLNELVEEVLKETRLIDTEHTITCATNEVVNVIADRGLIKQALRIFLDNSLKFTPPDGTISVNSYLKDKRVKLVIEDNGIGIPKEDLPYIFDRFYKCDKSRTRESGGAGLGLSIAKWIIEKHNGTIDVESAVGKGTKVIITMPLQ